jgi:Fic family protein
MENVAQGGGLHVRPNVAARERRLAARLAEVGRKIDDADLLAVVEDAQLLGSLELAGIRARWEDVRSSRAAGEAPGPVGSLRRASHAVERRSPLTVDAIRAWHAALAGPVGFRRDARMREGPPPAPPALIPDRLALLEMWLGARSAEDLQPEQAAALAMARIVEILPFDDGNGRVARLAASHVMVRGGRRPPILVGADAPRLVAALQAAFRLETAELATLLDEASHRALDVMIQALEKSEV